MVKIAAGINIRSPIKAMRDAEEINTPREKTWLKEEKRSPRQDKNSTAVVDTSDRAVMAWAFIKQVRRLPSGPRAIISLLNCVKKWMESSTDNPNEITAAKMVNGSRGIWNQPMIPKIVMRGNRLGIRLNNPSTKEFS